MKTLRGEHAHRDSHNIQYLSLFDITQIPTGNQEFPASLYLLPEDQ